MNENTDTIIDTEAIEADKFDAAVAFATNALTITAYATCIIIAGRCAYKVGKRLGDRRRADRAAKTANENVTVESTETETNEN